MISANQCEGYVNPVGRYRCSIHRFLASEETKTRICDFSSLSQSVSSGSTCFSLLMTCPIVCVYSDWMHFTVCTPCMHVHVHGMLPGREDVISNGSNLTRARVYLSSPTGTRLFSLPNSFHYPSATVVGFIIRRHCRAGEDYLLSNVFVIYSEGGVV